MLVSGGCSRDEAATAFVAPTGPAMVVVRTTEHRFAHPAVIRAGRVVVRARNAGQLGHEVLLVRLPDDIAVPLAEQVLSDTRVPVETVGQLGLMTGDRGSFAVDLAPGRYGFVCFVTDPDGETHARKGMASDLTVVAGGASSRDKPSASAGAR